MEERGDRRLSYKFQRLREQIRESVLRGEFRDQLPGERELGHRFKANAKTINKALSDLSSEGVLVRRIGRGTFVAKRNGNGAGDAAPSRSVHVLVRDTGPLPSYRAALLALLAKELRAKDYKVGMTAGPARASKEDIPLEAWPAAIRHATEALVFYPDEPLSKPFGRLSEQCIAEAYRRHVPVVAIGSLAQHARINAVVPDYVEAGFRLAEHLFRLGCGEIVALLAGGASREARLVVTGCRTARARWSGQLHTLHVPESAFTRIGLEEVLAVSPTSVENATRGTINHAGLVCVGRRALEAVIATTGGAHAELEDPTLVTCVPEPGDSAPEQAGVTAYETDAGAMASWTARLIIEARPGQRPVEIIVPGELRIRRSTEVRAAAPPSCRML
jgi:DNA-binding LacI/PurR family transcriptional regulator